MILSRTNLTTTCPWGKGRCGVFSAGILGPGLEIDVGVLQADMCTPWS